MKIQNQARISNLMRSFEGNNKIAFDALMTQLGEANDLIDEHEEKIIELESLARDDSNRIAARSEERRVGKECRL